MKAPGRSSVSEVSRRAFVGQLPAVVAVGVVGAQTALRASTPAGAAAGAGVGPAFPAQDPALVREIVGVSHRDLARVTELVTAHPELAKAAYDWGFGDWESALGAAAHTGRREIAEVLLAHGAQPTLFSAAMLGQLGIVRAFVEGSPGIQGCAGPHGISLLDHALAGGERAAEVVAYLESVGGADTPLRQPAGQPLDVATRDALVGSYSFGPSAEGRIEVNVAREMLGLTVNGGSRRNLFHVGDLTFYPAGAYSVRFAFTSEGDRVSGLTVVDGPLVLTAQRLAAPLPR
jgi:hypothetical protein